MGQVVIIGTCMSWKGGEGYKGGTPKYTPDTVAEDALVDIDYYV